MFTTFCVFIGLLIFSVAMLLINMIFFAASQRNGVGFVIRHLLGTVLAWVSSWGAIITGAIIAVRYFAHHQ